MTNEMIPDSIMEFYDGGKMDKQQYKEMLSNVMMESDKHLKESERLLLTAARYMDKLNRIWHIVEDTPNDNELGKKMRELYYGKNKIPRT